MNNRSGEDEPAFDPLGSLQGLGPKSAAMLRRAGIESVEQLQALGGVRAFIQVRASGQRPSLNLLWALEGALQGVPWTTIAKEQRTGLLLALDDIERGCW